MGENSPPWWPLPNVWVGVSIENQETADARIPPLLDTPAAIHWLSCEPLLGPINLDYWMAATTFCGCGAENCGDVDVCNDCGKSDSLITTWGREQADRMRYGERYDEQSELGMMDVEGKTPMINWVVVGGESGPKARPMDIQWVRSLRDQCLAAGIPFNFKQWGEFDCNGDHVGRKKSGRILDGQIYNDYPTEPVLTINFDEPIL